MNRDRTRFIATTALLTLSIAINPSGAHAGEAAGDKDEPAPPSVIRLFTVVPSDLVRFVSVDTAKVLGVGGGAALWLHAWDKEIAEANASNQTGNDAYTPGDWYGAFLTQTALGLTVYGIGRASKDSHLANVGARLVGAQFVSQPWVVLLKYATQRERPDGENRHSFPSSHTAAAFATASVLQDGYGWKIGAPAYALAAYVGAARVVHNKHYLSDVVFGATLGLAGGRFAVRTHGGRTIAARVVPVPRGASVVVSISPSRR
jgi:membrane-associated phospholipid phosphatase